jgi:glycosyltransferase involved in cell wall biosynthesis
VNRLPLDEAHLAILGPCSPAAVVRLLGEIDLKAPDLLDEGTPVNVFVANISSAFNSVSVLTYSRHAQKISTYSYKNITFFVFPLRSNKFWILDWYRVERKQIVKILRKINPTIVHAHWTYEYAVAALTYRKKVLITVHDNPLNVVKLTPDLLRLQKYLMSLFVRIVGFQSTFIFVSNSLLHSWTKDYWLNKYQIVIYNFNKIEITNNLNFIRSPVEITSIGNASHLKNISGLLQAWNHLRHEFPGIVINLIGVDLDMNSEFCKLWRDLLGNSVIWHGYCKQSEVIKILDNTSIYVHLSHEESQCLSVVEAMSRGCVCIINQNVPALRETTSGYAILVDVHSPESVLDGLRTAILDEELRNSLALGARGVAAQKFNSKVISDEILAVYKNFLGNTSL